MFVLAGLVCLPAYAAPDYYLSFNGSNCTSTGADPSVFAVSTGTFELWYRSTDTTDDRLFAGTYNYNGGYCFKVYNSGSTSICRFVFVHSGGGVEVEQTSSVNIRDGEWHHLAATWDSGTVSLWIDGVFEWSDLISTPVAGGNMMFGCVPASAHIEACDIGLVRLSSSVQYTASPFTPPTTFTADGNTVGLWTMAEGSGVTAHDSSANDYDATLYPDSNANYPVWSLGGGTSTIGITVDPVATDITYDSASILWSVANTTGQEAAHTVYYWLDGAANTPTNSASASNDPGNGQVSVTLTNLLLGQSYDYYVQSSNAVASAMAPTASPGYNQFTTADVGSGYYLSFNGGNHAVATNSEAFAPSAGTFELWYRSTDTTDDRLFAGTYNNGGGYCFKVYNSGGTSKCRFVFVDGASPPELEQTSSVNIRDGQWHHLAATWGNNELRLWIDGEFESFVEISSPVAGGNMMFGCVPASDHIEACDIGLARLSNSERYTGTSFSPPTTLIADSNTVGLWTMADGSGETANDSSGNDYDAALVADSSNNNPTWGSEVIVITVAPAATDITCTSASILWTVTNTTSRTALHTVHYWLDGTDGILNPSIAAAGSDPGSGQVSVSLGSLQANQTYDYYVRSSNIVACVTSPAGSFSQFATKAYVLITNTPTRGVVDTATRSTTLSWGIENNSGQSAINGVFYMWDTGTDYGYGWASAVTAANQPQVVVTINNLVAGATYSFVAASSISGHDGESGYSSSLESTFTVSTEELPPPTSAISIFNVSASPDLISDTTALISWNVAYTNASDYGTASHFVLVSSNAAPTVLENVLLAQGMEDDMGNVWAILSGLSPGQTNYFSVQSILDPSPNRFATDDNDGMYYAFTNTVSSEVPTDPWIGTIAMAEPPVAGYVSATNAVISWQVAPLDSAYASHFVIYSANNPPTLQNALIAPAVQCDASNVVALLTQLQPGCDYRFGVQSVMDFTGGHYATNYASGLYYPFTTLPAGNEPVQDNYSSFHDGVPDWWKLANGFSVFDASVPDVDSDGDGYSNAEEFVGNTNPMNAGSMPAACDGQKGFGITTNKVFLLVTFDVGQGGFSYLDPNAPEQSITATLESSGPGIGSQTDTLTIPLPHQDNGALVPTYDLTSMEWLVTPGETYTFKFNWGPWPTIPTYPDEPDHYAYWGVGSTFGATEYAGEESCRWYWAPDNGCQNWQLETPMEGDGHYGPLAPVNTGSPNEWTITIPTQLPVQITPARDLVITNPTNIVTFTATVNGGVPPYKYEWGFENGNPPNPPPQEGGLSVSSPVNVTFGGTALGHTNSCGVVVTDGTSRWVCADIKTMYVPVEVVGRSRTNVFELAIGKMAEPGVLTNQALNIDLDPDRFYIRIPGANSLNLGTVSVQIATVGNESGYNQAPFWIDLQAEGTDLISKSLLLVSDTVDNKAVPQRTLITQLGGKFQVSALKINGKEYKTDKEIPVPVKRTITVRLVRCRYGDGATDLCWTNPQYDDLKKKLQERYAQVGVRFIFDPVTGPKISAWGIGGGGWTGYGEYPKLENGTIEVPDGIRTLFNGFPTNTPTLFLVNGIGHPLLDKGDAGISCVPRKMNRPDLMPFHNKSLVAPPGGLNKATPLTGPHELLHLLLNAGHDDTAYSAECNNRLMLWHCELFVGTVCNNDVSDTKRISANQANTVAP